MCAEGAGAICYYEKISHLKETCKSAASLLRSTSDSMDVAPTVQLSTLGDGYGVHDDLRDEGCGMHVFCGYCTGDCATSEVERYLSVTYNGSKLNCFRKNVCKPRFQIMLKRPRSAWKLKGRPASQAGQSHPQFVDP